LAQRTQATLLSGFAVLGALLLLLVVPPLFAADPKPIACPSGQTIFVEGRAPARESLLIYFNSRAVGGGIADGAGAYRLPLRVQERPGNYPVEVRLRGNRAVVERFTCFVDVELGSEASPTPTLAAPVAPVRPTVALPTATRLPSPSPGPPPGVSGTPTASPTAATVTPSPTGPTATPSPSPTGPTATPTRTLAAGEPSPTPSATATAGAVDVQITDIVLLDPSYADSEEYVQIKNLSRNRQVNLRGWRLTNTSRPDGVRAAVPAFVFPDFTLRVDTTIAVYSASGTNDLAIGDFFWGQPQSVWKTGDRAELRDEQGNLVYSFTVSNDQ
jgi:hypothetical protein